MNIKIHKGFTLIELIVVIAILGILAAIALPRFIGLQKEAKIAKMQGLYGSIRSATMLARSRCELDLAAGVAVLPNLPCSRAASTTTFIKMDGQEVRMAYKYPAGGNNGNKYGGIVAAAQIDTTNNGANEGLSIDYSGTTGVSISLENASDDLNCVILYQPATSTNPSPVISLKTTGC